MATETLRTNPTSRPNNQQLVYWGIGVVILALVLFFALRDRAGSNSMDSRAMSPAVSDQNVNGGGSAGSDNRYDRGTGSTTDIRSGNSVSGQNNSMAGGNASETSKDGLGSGSNGSKNGQRDMGAENSYNHGTANSTGR